MAERRMFHTAVVESDAFLDMPIGAQVLYFHLGMQADEDGFVNGPKQVARMLRRPPKELRILEESGFVFDFDGIMVIKHWRLANTLQKDRLKPLRYPEIARKIYLNEAKTYSLEGSEKENLYVLKNELLDSNWNPSIAEPSKAKQKKANNSINKSSRKEKKEAEGERISPLGCASVEMTQERISPLPSLPVGVPGGRLADGAAALPTDPGHSLRSLHPPQAALPSLLVEKMPVDDEDAPAIVPDFGNGGENYDDTYVLLHRFGKNVVKLNKDQIEGLRRIMDEVELDIYVHRLAKQILEGNDPGAHYKTIKGWYEERRNGQYEA